MRISNFFKSIVVVIFFSHCIYSQSHQEDDKSHLPNFTPPSPSAMSLMTYGNNEANEYSGKVNLSIPIHNFTSGNLSLPVSLDYNAAGVKIDDFCTWTGINWVLKATGAITRTVVDYPDENSVRVFIDEADMLSNASNSCAPNSQFYYNTCLSYDVTDTEVDIFRFNFNGYSGSFYLDQNFNPVTIENEHELKIKILGNDPDKAKNLRDTKTFMITTPDGVNYYFGGNETETSSPFSGTRHNVNMANTSFYLYKIEHPINGTILFEYRTVPVAYFTSKYIDNIIMPSVGVSVWENVPAPHRTVNGVLINNLKYLQKIKSTLSTSEIVFNTTDLPNTTTGSYCFLNSIDIKENSQIIKKVDLSYYAKNIPSQPTNDITTAKRFFLEKVEFNKGFTTENNKNEVYALEYNSPANLPARLSLKQDILGYYNGKNNTSLVPYNESMGEQTNSFGDRTPDFNYAIYGSLKKIIYPTKGYTQFEYEPKPAKEKVYTTFFGTVCRESLDCLNPQHIPGYDFSGEYIDFPTVIQEQWIDIKLTAGSSPEEYRSNKTAKVKLDIIDLTESSKSETFMHTLGDSITSSHYVKFRFLKNHNYRLEFSTYYDLGRTSSFGGSFKFTMFTHYRETPGFGVRLKRQKDFDDNANTQLIKSYKYTGVSSMLDNLSNLQEITLMPIIKLFLKTPPNDGNPDTYDEISGLYFNIHSNSHNSYKNFENNPLVAISYGGDNFEKGGIEKYFQCEEDDAITRIYSLNDGCWVDPVSQITRCGPPVEGVVGFETSIQQVRRVAESYEVTDNSMFNGKLLQERVYKNVDNSLYKVKETTYNYMKIPKNEKAVNFVGYHLWGNDYDLPNHCPNSSADIFPVGSCYMGYYYHRTYDFHLESITKKDFIEPVPLSLYYFYDINLNPDPETEIVLRELEDQKKQIITTQSFEYGALRGLPTRIISTTSDEGVNSIIENKYANQANSLTSLTSTQLNAFTTLVNQNKVDTPIEVAHYSGSELLSKQRTLYKSWNNNSNMVLPEIIQSSKGSNDLENRVIFSEYDAKGNPTTVSLSSGPKTKYFYNSNNQVYLKIENDQSTLDPNINPISGDECNFRNQYPNALITTYSYDALTHQIVKITDANCRNTYYEYDALHHLKTIKDHDGNILKEYDNNYRP